MLYMSGGTYSLKSIQLNDRIFEKLFHGRFISSQTFYQKSAEKKWKEEKFLYFHFDVWPGVELVPFV